MFSFPWENQVLRHLSSNVFSEPGFNDGGVLSTAAVDALNVPHHLGLLENQRLVESCEFFLSPKKYHWPLLKGPKNHGTAFGRVCDIFSINVFTCQKHLQLLRSEVFKSVRLSILHNSAYNDVHINVPYITVQCIMYTYDTCTDVCIYIYICIYMYIYAYIYIYDFIS